MQIWLKFPKHRNYLNEKPKFSKVSTTLAFPNIMIFSLHLGANI